MRAKLYFDGGCRPTNPGVAAFASILVLENGTRKHISRYIGWRTNNYAEYCGLIVGVKLAIDNNVNELDIYTDSQLIRGHMQGGWKRNIADLRVLIREAEKLLLKLGYWNTHWVPRKQNQEADALCTATIVSQQNENPWRKKLGITRRDGIYQVI